MGNSEEGKSSKSDDKSATPATTEQGTVQHVYPEWPAMQAYYGPRVALPPYFNSAVASGHPPPPYVWGPPQAMMPPYGAPYAAIYSHGGVYGHPAVAYGSQPPGQGPPTAAAGKTEALGGTGLSIDRPVKPSGNTDQGLVKKLKSFDGLAMSIGNGNSEKHEGVSENRSSQSGESAGSSNGSGGSTDETEETKRKRSREGSAVTETQPASPPVDGKASSAGEKVLGVSPVSTAANGDVKMVIGSPSVGTTLELRNPGIDANCTPMVVAAPNAIIPPETWMQNERELKKERRKQSNRESARRSRLRKQAETEELAKKVEVLSAENMALKAEINQLVENSGKLRQENAKLMEELQHSKPDQPDESGSNRVGNGSNSSPMNTENLLSRVNNSMGLSSEEGGESGDVFASNSGAKKLHQLLDTSRRADAVAAG